MINRSLRCYAPDAAVDESAAALESDPTAMKGWLSSIGELAGAGEPSQPAQTKKDTDGNTDAATAGSSATAGGAAAGKGASGNADANAAATAAANAAAQAKSDADKAASDKAAVDKAAQDAAGKAGDDLDEEKWPRNQDDWKRFKAIKKKREDKFQAEIKAEREQRQAIEAKLKELETTGVSKASGEVSPEIKAQLDAVTKERDELSQRLEIADVTSHPRFQAYFKNQVDEQIQIATDIVGEEKGKQFQELLQLPDGQYKKDQIEEFVGDLSTLDQSRIGGVLNDLAKISRAKKAEIAKSGEHKKTIDTKNQEAANINRKQLEKTFEDVLTGMQDPKTGMVVWQKRENDPEWNKGVDTRRQQAIDLLLGKNAKPADVMKAALNSVSLPFILERYKSHMQEKDDAIAMLEEQVKTLTAATPGSGRGGSATPAPGEETHQREISKEMSPHEAAANFTAKLWKDT